MIEFTHTVGIYGKIIDVDQEISIVQDFIAIDNNCTDEIQKTKSVCF